jgi:hypothetical protein
LENLGVCATTDKLNTWRWSDEITLGAQLLRSNRRLPGVTDDTQLFPG